MTIMRAQEWPRRTMKGLPRPVASSSSYLLNPSVRIWTQDRPLPAALGVSKPGPRRGFRNRKWNRPKFYSWIAPEPQVRPVGAILRPPPRAFRPGCGSKSQAQSPPLPKTLGGRSQEREPEGLNVVQIRPPGPIRGQKAEQTKILSTNRI
ncbi:hypothetical protein ACLKA7_005570 [Drosophila subpalustris]